MQSNSRRAPPRSRLSARVLAALLATVQAAGAMALAADSTIASTDAAQSTPTESGLPLAPASGSVPLPAPPGADAATPACRCVPAGTPIVVEVTDRLVSDERKAGDGFALRLAEPVMLDGAILLPAGTSGRGEIVHAAKARGGGRAGELLLAARYLELDGRRIPLRGMKLGAAGKDNSGVALAASIGIGVFAHFIRGGEMEVPPGTRAQAKLAVALDPASLALPASTPVASPEADPSPVPSLAPSIQE